MTLFVHQDNTLYPYLIILSYEILEKKIAPMSILSHNLNQWSIDSLNDRLHAMVALRLTPLRKVILLLIFCLGILKSFIFADFNIDRYLGTWYEIARFDNPFQDKCIKNVQANYQRLANGNIEIINTCVDKNQNISAVKGVARSQSKQDPSKLEVSFFDIFGWRPIWGDYWILYYDSDYNWSVVGDRKSKFGWILSRTPTLDETTINIAKSIFKEYGYDPKTLILTTQDIKKEKKDTQ